MLVIDGSHKSGSGTVVRDALAFAFFAGQPVKLNHIRSGRDKPGLRPQHLMAVQAAARISRGRLQGAAAGAMQMEYNPGESVEGGHFEWDIGTAGSTALMTLTLLPMALFARTPSCYLIGGGLFQDFAPSVFHLKFVLFPLLRAMGAEVDLRIIQPGYMPRGQGQIEVRIGPLKSALRSLTLTRPGYFRAVKGIGLASLLHARKVSERMIGACQAVLQAEGCSTELEARYDEADRPAFERPAVAPGACLAIWADAGAGGLIGADMAGARRRPAEHIGKQVARQFLADVATGATVDRHLADQLIPYAALAEGKTSYRIPRMTEHIESRLWLISEMLGAKWELEGSRLGIAGIGYRPPAV